jgi:hypothetical protein
MIVRNIFMLQSYMVPFALTVNPIADERCRRADTSRPMHMARTCSFVARNTANRRSNHEFAFFINATTTQPHLHKPAALFAAPSNLDFSITMRQHKEVSPLFKIGRGDSIANYDELDQYDDNWELRDVPLEQTGSPSSDAAETELTQRRRGSLHHDEEEAVLCPLVFMGDNDESSLESQQSSNSQYIRDSHSHRRATTRAHAWWPVRRRGRPKKSTIWIGVVVFIVAALVLLAWFPTISEHAVAFKSSLNKSRQLRPGPSDRPDEDVRVTFPASIYQFSKSVSSALDALF